MFSACVLIPVYNHEHAIDAVVASVRLHGLPIVLVDDGSDAACAQALQRLSAAADVTLLRHERNRGKGAAVATGLRAAREAGFTHALQVDADGQHALADIGRLIDEARAHPGAVICGRPIFDESIPKVRYYCRYMTHGLVWFETLSFEIIDSMCGFRVYPLGPTMALLDRRTLGARMAFDTEVLVRLVWKGTPTRWVDTRVSYPLDGVSHYRMVLDNVYMVGLHTRLVLGALLRAPMLLTRLVMRTAAARSRKSAQREHA